MKPFTARLFAPAVTTLAATLVLSFGTAAANAQTVKGSIPFGFTVAHKTMAAGTYAIAPVSNFDTGEPLVLRNINDNRAVIAGVLTHVALANNETPRIEFACGADNCRLVRVYSRTAKWEIVQPAPNKVERERVATVYLTTESAH